MRLSGCSKRNVESGMDCDGVADDHRIYTGRDLFTIFYCDSAFLLLQMVESVLDKVPALIAIQQV